RADVEPEGADRADHHEQGERGRAPRAGVRQGSGCYNDGVMTELEEIQQKYESGRLDPIKRDLERFIEVHRAQIESFRQELGAKLHLKLTDDNVIKQYILKHRSINAEA